MNEPRTRNSVQKSIPRPKSRPNGESDFPLFDNDDVRHGRSVRPQQTLPTGSDTLTSIDNLTSDLA